MEKGEMRLRTTMGSPTTRSNVMADSRRPREKLNIKSIYPGHHAPSLHSSSARTPDTSLDSSHFVTCAHRLGIERCLLVVLHLRLSRPRTPPPPPTSWALARTAWSRRKTSEDPAASFNNGHLLPSPPPPPTPLFLLFLLFLPFPINNHSRPSSLAASAHAPSPPPSPPPSSSFLFLPPPSPPSPPSSSSLLLSPPSSSFLLLLLLLLRPQHSSSFLLLPPRFLLLLPPPSSPSPSSFILPHQRCLPAPKLKHKKPHSWFLLVLKLRFLVFYFGAFRPDALPPSKIRPWWMLKTAAPKDNYAYDLS
eukprot:2024921-Rhodomonas_salina.1